MTKRSGRFVTNVIYGPLFWGDLGFHHMQWICFPVCQKPNRLVVSGFIWITLWETQVGGQVRLVGVHKTLCSISTCHCVSQVSCWVMLCRTYPKAVTWTQAARPGNFQEYLSGKRLPDKQTYWYRSPNG